MRTIVGAVALLFLSTTAFCGDAPANTKSPSAPNKTGSTGKMTDRVEPERTPGITPEDKANLDREMSRNILQSIEEKLKRLED